MIRDGRTGFAYAGMLDASAIAEVLAEARDNVQFGTADEWAGLAEPDGVDVIEQDLWSDELAEFATDAQDRPGQGARAADAGDRSAACVSTMPTTPTSPPSRPSPPRPASAGTGRENGCYVVVSTLADDGDETQTGFGFSVGRAPAEFDLAKAAKDASDRATRLLGAHQAGDQADHGGPRPVRHGQLPRHHLPAR